MSFLQHPDAINSQNLQIWNNAAFDADGLAARLSWRPLQPISTNRPEPLDLDSGKENRSPAFPKSPVSKKSPAPVRPLRPKPDPPKPSKQSTPKPSKKFTDGDADGGGIDAEIEEIEREIGRLSARLEALRIKKAERESRAAASGRRGRIVPAKFMDPKQGLTKDLETPDAKKESPASPRIRQRGVGSSKNLQASALKKIEESPASSRLQRRGVSLGPMEIHNSVRFQQLEAPEGTPLGSVQSRRKSCFWTLEGIQEEKGVSKERQRGLCSSPKSRRSVAKAPDRSKKVAESPADPASVRIRGRGVSLGPSEIAASTRFRQPGKLQQIKDKGVKEKGRSMSASPKSRSRSVTKVTDLRKGIATVGAKKSVPREDGSSTSLKPKALFQEAKNSVPSKRPSKNTKVRVVASRYSLATARLTGDEPGSKRRKWSLPEPGKEEVSRADNKRSLSLGESSTKRGSENPMNGECEIPSGVEGKGNYSLSAENSPPTIAKIAESLPMIRTSRCTVESPRDSGCAKRVADLVGRKRYFGLAEVEAAASPCEAQALIFEEEEQ